MPPDPSPPGHPTLDRRAVIVHARPAPGTGAPTLCAEPGPVPDPGGEATCGDCIALLNDPRALAAHLDALRVIQHELAPLLLTESLAAAYLADAAETLSNGSPLDLLGFVASELAVDHAAMRPRQQLVAEDLDEIAEVSLRAALLLLNVVRAARGAARAMREAESDRGVS